MFACSKQLCDGCAVQESAAPLTGATSALGEQLIRMMKLLVSLREHAPAPLPGVDNTHYPVLFQLAREPQRVSDLAGCVHADVSTVSRQVSHLVQHGLAVKIPDPGDGRAHRVTLTPDGHSAIVRITDTRAAWLSQVMADWTEPDAREFVRLISRFTDDLEAAKAGLESRATRHTSRPTPA